VLNGVLALGNDITVAVLCLVFVGHSCTVLVLWLVALCCWVDCVSSFCVFVCVCRCGVFVCCALALCTRAVRKCVRLFPYVCDHVQSSRRCFWCTR